MLPSALTDPHERELKRKGFRSHVHEQAYRDRQLSARQQRTNRTKSCVRVRGEHVFAAMTQMGGITVRSIAIERMKACSTMKALSYNLNASRH